MLLRKTVDASKIALVGSIAAFGSVAMAAESADPIKIVLNNWSSQQVLAHVSGKLLETAGYHVEYHPADAQLQFPAIGNGDLHFQTEVWEGTMRVPFEQQVARGCMIDAGTHQATTREEWWYPDYVEELCPGLPDWKALNECADEFATPDTSPQGRYLAGPRDWERPDRERVEALGLSFEIVNADAQVELWAELREASRRQQPIVLMNWTPNWVQARYPGSFVEFPQHAPECESDGSWGINPNLAHDCGNPVEGWLKKGVWSGLAEKWSCAFELIENISFDNAQIETAAAYAEIDEMSPEQAAERWIAENGEIWQQWMPACAEALQLAAATTPSESVVEASSVTKTPDAEMNTGAAGRWPRWPQRRVRSVRRRGRSLPRRSASWCHRAVGQDPARRFGNLGGDPDASQPQPVG